MGVASGGFTTPGSTGNQAVTGLGFEPVAVMLWGQTDIHNDLRACAGATDGTNEWVFFRSYERGSQVRKRASKSDHLLLTYDNAGSVVWQASVVSLDSDGFTINFDTATRAGDPIQWWAIGGSQIPDAKVGTITCGSSTGTTAETGLGFRPNGLFLAHDGEATLDNGLVGTLMFGFGGTDGTSSLACAAWADATADSRDDDQQTGKIAVADDGTNTYAAELDSFDSGGFTVDVTDAWTADIEHGYLAFASEAVYVSTVTAPSSTGTQAVTGAGMQPGLVLVWGAGNPLGGANRHRLMLGAATSTSNRVALADDMTDSAFGVAYATGFRDTSSLVRLAGDGGYSSVTLEYRADLSSIDTDGFTLDWNVVTSGYEPTFGFMCLPGVVFIPQIYRLVSR
jgi:hypothetical protein